MAINSDFSKRALVHSQKIDWVPSPMAGVDRRMLDRIGEEVARATSIVRYAPGSHFSAHVHSGGEEFIVLDGVFQDEHGDYSAGTYVRNPPTTSHTPGSAEGCTIFVKLWQFDQADRTQFHKVMADELSEGKNGIATALLHEDTQERVTYSELEAEATLETTAAGGIEVLILDGTASVGDDVLERHSWLRLPEGQGLSLTAGKNGVKVWMKTGHLPYAKAPSA